MEEFDCLQSYVGVPLAGELRRGLRVAINDPFAKGHCTPEQAPDYVGHHSVLDMHGINEQILFEVGMRSDIERFVEGMIVTPDVDRSHFLQQSLGSSHR